MQDMLMSSGFDWFMFALTAICAVVIASPLGEKVIAYLTPRDQFNQRKKLSEDVKRKYRKGLIIFFVVLAVDELLAALLLEKVPAYNYIYMGLAFADLVIFGFFTKNLLYK